MVSAAPERGSGTVLIVTQDLRPGLIYAAPTALLHRDSFAFSASRQCGLQRNVIRVKPVQSVSAQLLGRGDGNIFGADAGGELDLAAQVGLVV